MQEPKHYPVVYVDEVEQVRLLFSKFFRLSTDNAEFNIPSKLENIYNYEEFKHSGNKDLIASNYLLRKIVMMYQAEECRNFLHHDVGAFLTEMRGWLRRSNGEVDYGGGAFVFGAAGALPRPSALPIVEEEDDSEEDEEEELLGADQIDVGLTERSGKRKEEPLKEQPTLSSLVRDRTILQSGSKSRANIRTEPGSKTPGLKGKAWLGQGTPQRGREGEHQSQQVRPGQGLRKTRGWAPESEGHEGHARAAGLVRSRSRHRGETPYGEGSADRRSKSRKRDEGSSK